jgi:nitroimidazol reductase NimA-like FMN-containing flavoprotein (pyridoxamine 5'-phosphate oxidase superfamily)
MLGELTSGEIDGVLRREAIGRIGCYAFGRPYVVPITYAYDGVAVYGHSREGLKLRMMRSHPTGGFEVERFERTSSWQSVIALGTFS